MTSYYFCNIIYYITNSNFFRRCGAKIFGFPDGALLCEKKDDQNPDFGGIALARFKQSPAVLKIIEFSRRHKWSKLLCMGAVSLNYAVDVISSKIYSPVNKMKKTAEEISAPISRRILSGLACAAFTVMALPLNTLSVYAAEGSAPDTENISAESEIEDAPDDSAEYTEGEEGSDTAAISAEEGGMYAGILGLAETAVSSTEYDESVLQNAEANEEAEKETAVNVRVSAKEDGIKIAIDSCFENDSISITDMDAEGSRQLEVLYRSSEGKNTISKAFDSYGIPHENMNINAFELSVYDEGTSVQPEENVKLYVEVPDDMINHRDDLKAVRLDGDRLEILDSVYARNKDGDLYISFDTDHFSTFALVSYADQPEDLESEAGENDAATPVGSMPEIVLGEVKEGKAAAKRKKYRIIKKIRKCDLIF